MLGAFTSELDKIAPKFEIKGSQIQILRTPSEFYESLKVGTWHCEMLNDVLMEVGKDTGSREPHFSVYIVHRENRT